MKRFFNTAGPVRTEDHYCLPPLGRFNLAEILNLIEQEKYFVLHAPRQTGKTSILLALRDYLNAEGQYTCLYINVEVAQSARENVERGIKAIIGEMASRARDLLQDEFLLENMTDILQQFGAEKALNELLTVWAQYNSKPTIILIDEIDSLIGDTLISVLRQLRAGYDKRPSLFPQSVILCGVRDVRDYRIHSAQEKSIITGAFNIKAESLRLGNFSLEDIKQLYQQHTEATGQRFEADVFPELWDLTKGQPWLVNALGYEVCFKTEAIRNQTAPITRELIIQATENIILRRETHLDQLVDKLQEERVRRVIEPILAGGEESSLIPNDDISYVRDLGLISSDKQLRIANRIYQEVIPRELNYSSQMTIAQETAWYVQADGTLDMTKLLTAFQQFYCENSEAWLKGMPYREAAPQLLLQAFLQRIINGRIEREYGLGRRRTDLLVIWPYGDGVQRVVLELKILYRSLANTKTEGVKQTWEYMDRCGTEEGHLIIFDRREKRSWSKKIFRQQVTFQGHVVGVWGI